MISYAVEREKDPVWQAHHQATEAERKRKRIETMNGKSSGGSGVRRLGVTTDALIVNPLNHTVATEGELKKNGFASS